MKLSATQKRALRAEIESIDERNPRYAALVAAAERRIRHTHRADCRARLGGQNREVRP